MRYLSSVYFVSQYLHVSGISVAFHHEVYCVYTTVGTCCAFELTVCWPGKWCWLCGRKQSTKKHNTYQLLYIYSIPPDDGLQTCPKHVEVDWRNKQRINSALFGFYCTHTYIELQGQQDIRFRFYVTVTSLIFRVVSATVSRWSWDELLYSFLCSV